MHDASIAPSEQLKSSEFKLYFDKNSDLFFQAQWGLQMMLSHQDLTISRENVVGYD